MNNLNKLLEDINNILKTNDAKLAVDDNGYIRLKFPDDVIELDIDIVNGKLIEYTGE